MERSAVKDRSDTTDIGLCNYRLAKSAIQSALAAGVEEFFVCPAARNAPLVALLASSSLPIHYGFEERATAFFALGRAKRTLKPVAIITTSGTAVGELLPAVMEADYTSIPLLLMTADRPRSYRGSGAPQACLHMGIFSHYVGFSLDCETKADLSSWDQTRPAHLNLCFDEPLLTSLPPTEFTLSEHHKEPDPFFPIKELNSFLNSLSYPLVIVNGLPPDSATAAFLKHLNAPVLLETTSNIRVDHLAIARRSKILETAHQQGYPIDGILRIGGVPTLRLWRDLEEKRLPLFNLSHLRFSGMSWADVHQTSLTQFPKTKSFSGAEKWIQEDRLYSTRLAHILKEEPLSEPALIHQLSKKIPQDSFVFLGNSLPIREWDLVAEPHFSCMASRGLNGIDGQISTFLGACTEGENWGLFGDLTALYDLTAPWFMPHKANIVVINNGGGKIFSRMFPQSEFQNNHQLNFSGFAQMWGLKYELWREIPKSVESETSRIIEIVPDTKMSDNFWNKLALL